MRILYYDVETASPQHHSVCAVGWILTDNDAVVKRGGSLIDPRCQFSQKCIDVHGITPDMVNGAPSFLEYWNSCLSDLMDNALVVAYNAGFDMDCTVKALMAAGVFPPSIHYMDALAVTRKCVSASSHKLSDLAPAAGFRYHAHDPLEDCDALFHLLKYVASEAKLEDVAELLFHSLVPVQCTDSSPSKKPDVSPAPQINYAAYSHFTGHVDATSDSLSGLRFCITGGVPGVDREVLEKKIMECGGIPTAAVSARTDYLVVGDYDLYPAGYISNKHKKALELAADGGKIKIIGMDDLLQMMGLALADITDQS